MEPAVGAVEPTAVEQRDLEHRRQVVIGGADGHGERLVVVARPLDRGATTTPERLVVAAALITVDTFSTRCTALTGKVGFCDPNDPPAWAMIRLVPSFGSCAWRAPWRSRSARRPSTWRRHR